MYAPKIKMFISSFMVKESENDKEPQISKEGSKRKMRKMRMCIVYVVIVEIMQRLAAQDCMRCSRNIDPVVLQ